MREDGTIEVDPRVEFDTLRREVRSVSAMDR